MQMRWIKMFTKVFTPVSTNHNNINDVIKMLEFGQEFGPKESKKTKRT